MHRRILLDHARIDRMAALRRAAMFAILFGIACNRAGLPLPSDDNLAPANGGPIIPRDAGNGADLAGDDGSGGGPQPTNGWTAIDARELTQSELRLAGFSLDTRVIINSRCHRDRTRSRSPKG
jgi:hypothetical protein